MRGEVGDKALHTFQGYVRFPNAKTMQQMRKFVPRAHLEVAKVMMPRIGCTALRVEPTYSK